ncbi:hypothetical protein OFN53_37200, partial [Escherichia coli]|nr:hypothetical protein [Escherichia coli]
MNWHSQQQGSDFTLRQNSWQFGRALAARKFHLELQRPEQDSAIQEDQRIQRLGLSLDSQMALGDQIGQKLLNLRLTQLD